jgi:hypothetical protein
MNARSRRASPITCSEQKGCVHTALVGARMNRRVVHRCSNLADIRTVLKLGRAAAARIPAAR